MADEQLQDGQIQEGVEQHDAHQEDDFDSGFALNQDEDGSTEKTEPQDAPASNQNTEQQTLFSDKQEGQQFQQQLAFQNQDAQRQYFQNQQLPQQNQEAQQQYFQNQQVPPPQQNRQQVKFVKVEDGIRAEFDELKKQSPKAAYLAQTDTEIGKRLRKHLETYGADYAQECAENYIARNELSKRIQNEEQQRKRAEYDARVSYFNNVMQSRQPEYRDLQIAAMQDPAKANELVAYQKEIMSWIEEKPYREAKSLMDIAVNGTDPNAVCDLLSRFQQERGKPQHQRRYRVDPTGAMAVPGSKSMPPSGVGDVNNFDAGWEINRKEK